MPTNKKTTKQDLVLAVSHVFPNSVVRRNGEDELRSWKSLVALGLGRRQFSSSPLFGEKKLLVKTFTHWKYCISSSRTNGLSIENVCGCMSVRVRTYMWVRVSECVCACVRVCLCVFAWVCFCVWMRFLDLFMWLVAGGEGVCFTVIC